jgi:hypothetical protein
VAAAKASGYLEPELSAISMNSGAALVNSGPRVLILADADGPSTNALASNLANAGFQVTVRPAPENTWDGTNPALTGYALVIHLNGFTWNTPLRAGGQVALTSFVQNGGGFIRGQWNGYESVTGNQRGMPNLVLQGTGTTAAELNCAQCVITYNVVPDQATHRVLGKLPASFTFRADGHDAAAQVTFATDPSTVLMRLPTGAPAVLVRQFGQGKVVNFSFAPNYGLGGMGVTLLDANVLRLYQNSAMWITGWTPDGDGDGIFDSADNCPSVTNADQANLDGDAAGDACDPDDDADGVADTADNCPMLANFNQYDQDRDGTGDACEIQADQTITFAELAAKAFGDADFTVAATSSSNLPVSFTASGKCTISEVTVHLTGAGECTITAHQEGNTSYKAAAEVSRTFNIAKGAAMLALGTLNATYNGGAIPVTVTSNPAGLTGVAVTYSGSTTPPTNAGSYAVRATLENENYQAAPVSGTLVIAKASATITVGSTFVYDGTPKQAKVTTSPEGLGTIVLTYAQNGVPVPWAINAGTYQVLARLENENYHAPDALGTLTIAPATPTIIWAEPAPIKPGTHLGAAQLNASATGVGGVSVAGNFVYTPAAGMVLKPGSYVLSVEFTSNDNNYTGNAAAIRIEVTPGSKLQVSTLNNSVKAPPAFNRVQAGDAVELTFTVEGYQGSTILQSGSPSSSPITCKAVRSEHRIAESILAARSGLRQHGVSKFKYIWKTDPNWAGTCRKLAVTLVDGSGYEALFRFASTGRESHRSEKRGKVKLRGKR